MVVLWVVNDTLPEARYLLSGERTEIKTTGGWVYGYARALLDHQELSLSIASVDASVKELTVLKGERITYYLVPCTKSKTAYDKKQEKYWRRIGEMAAPDVVHIHGTEYAHSLASLRVFGPEKTLVSIQGLKSASWEYYNQGLSPAELRKAWTFRDLLKGNMLHEQKAFRKSGELEEELLRECRHVIGRTSWDRARVKAINPGLHYHFCNEVLRPEFYDGSRWTYEGCRPHSIFLSQSGYAIKGLHQVLRAMPLVLREYPDATVRVAGWDICAAPWYRIHGYGKFIKGLAASNGVSDALTFTGYLNAEEIKQEYLRANLFVCPSSIENSPNSLGEAQILGVPCLASYVGGVMDMMKGDEENLYRFEEVPVLAEKICRVFADGERQTDLREAAALRHDPVRNSEQLMSIYGELAFPAGKEEK
ncbi:MAG: glycosyltransferase family 4 protein [Candidatus Cryptobacteroides sp.]